MDTTIHPCDNFYEYACGSWKKKNKRKTIKGIIVKLSEQRIEDLITEDDDPLIQKFQNLV